MKTIKILFISLLAILLMNFQCEADEPTTQDCNCEEVRYTLSAGDITYQYHSTIPREDLTCEDETNTINYNGFYHVQIVCE